MFQLLWKKKGFFFLPSHLCIIRKTFPNSHNSSERTVQSEFNLFFIHFDIKGQDTNTVALHSFNADSNLTKYFSFVCV